VWVTYGYIKRIALDEPDTLQQCMGAMLFAALKLGRVVFKADYTELPSVLAR